ncbi:MAG: GlsB/YeaQ/YmgE family stress response membrane protein [Cytophagales bacterium]|nr:GlsB/YeaQ/YmgE family stress response membrane protein [Armatimonadota bacterium]
MGWLTFLIVGLIAGIIAKAIMPGSRSEPGGWILTILLGVVGAYIGAFVGSFFGFGVGGNFIGSIVMATVGAIILIAVLRLFSSGRRAV